MPSSTDRKGGKNVPPFVDRSSERSTLEKALSMAIEGKGNMVFVRGEAGIGKSRLVAEVLEMGTGSDISILKGACLEYRREPYQPFKDMLAERLGIDRQRTYAENLLRINAVIDSELPGIRDQKSALIDLVFPMDEPLGGYKVEPEKLGLAMNLLVRKGFRTIFFGSTDRLLSLDIDPGSVEVIELGTDAPGSMDPRRLERIARTMSNSFKSYTHSMIVMDCLDMLVEANSRERVLGLIGILDSASALNGGIVLYPNKGSVGPLIEGERGLSEFLHIQGMEGSSDTEETRHTVPTIEVLYKLFREMSKRRPHVTVIEDLHWGDKATFNLIQYLARNISDQRHLIIGTLRDEHLAEEEDGASAPARDALRRFTREHLFQEISIGPLGEGSVHDLVRRIDGTEPEDDLIDEIMRETEGNPLYIMELLNLRSDEGAVRTHEIGPRTAASLVRRRIDSLGQSARKVLETAAVLNKHASLDLIGRTLGMEAEELLDPVDDLINMKFIIESEDHLEFEHSKVRESIYDMMDTEDRTRMHLSVARSLEQGLPPETPHKLEVLAFHYLRASEPKKALEYLLQVTETGNDSTTSEELLSRMIEGLDGLDRSVRDRTVSEMRARAMLKVAEIQETLERMDEALSTYRRLIELSEADGLSTFLSMANRRSGDIMLRFYKWDHTVDYYLRALHLAKRQDDGLEAAMTFHGLGEMYYLKGDYSRAVECFLKYLEPAAHTKGRSYVKGMMGLGDVYKDIGDFNQALVYYKLAVRNAEEYRIKDQLPLAYIRLSRVLMRLGDPGDAERLGEWAMDLSDDTTGRYLYYDVRTRFAETLLEMGNVKVAEECLNDLNNPPVRTYDRLLESRYLRASGVLRSKLRDHENAIADLSGSISLLETIQVPHHLGRSLMDRGLVRFQTMDIQGAIDDIGKANSIFKGLRSLHYQNVTASKIRELRFIHEGTK